MVRIHPYSKSGNQIDRKDEVESRFDNRISVTAINDLLKFVGISDIDSDLYSAILIEYKKYIGN